MCWTPSSSSLLCWKIVYAWFISLMRVLNRHSRTYITLFSIFAACACTMSLWQAPSNLIWLSVRKLFGTWMGGPAFVHLPFLSMYGITAMLVIGVSLSVSFSFPFPEEDADAPTLIGIPILSRRRFPR